MIELASIMVIIGILAAIAAPKFFEQSSFDNRGFHDQVIATLRYAQKAAIAQRRFVCIAFGANSIDLSYGSNSDCSAGHGALSAPSGIPYPLTNADATFSPLPSGFSFDCLGRPNSSATATGLCGNTLALLTAPRTVQVSAAAAITIEPETGYVH